MPINPISATLLRTGKVLDRRRIGERREQQLAGRESYRTASGTRRAPPRAASRCRTSTTTSSAAARRPARRADARGRGHVRLLLHRREPRLVLRPRDGKFVQSQSMVDGRWYATATTLGDGRIMAFSGLELSRRHQQHGRDLRSAERRRRWSSSDRPRRSRHRSTRDMRCCRTARSSSRARAAALERQRMDLQPGGGTWTSSARDDARPELRLRRPPAAPAADLRAEGHDLRRRQPRHERRRRSSTCPRPRRAGRRAEHVDRPHPDERGDPAQRQGSRGGRLGEQREPRHAG